MKFNPTNKRLSLSVIGISCLFALSACTESEQKEDAPPPTPVSVVSIEPEKTVLYSEVSGRVKAIRDAQVLARVTGNIETIDFEQGKEVKKDQLLFTIDEKPYKATANQAAASLKQAQATASSANSLSKRYASLIRSNAISQQEYDDARSQAALANASVEQAKASLENAEINLGYTEVTSPIDGIVGAALVTEGALVSEQSGSPLAIVQQLDEVYVDFNFSSSKLSQLKRSIAKGEIKAIDQDTAEVELITEDGELYEQKGSLLFTGVSVNPTTGEVALRAKFPNEDHDLLPGMYVKVKLEQGALDNALLVPTQAIQRTSDGKSKVIVVEDEKAKDVFVQTDSEIDGRTIIKDGLKAGDQVIVEGFTKVRAGAPVKAVPYDKDDKKVDDKDIPDEEEVQENPSEASASND